MKRAENSVKQIAKHLYIVRAAAPTAWTSTGDQLNTKRRAAPVPASLGTTAAIAKAARARIKVGTAITGKDMKMLSKEIQELLTNARKWELVGSRITCNPPPMDTDQDVLVFVEEERASQFIFEMENIGFSVELGEGYAADALNSGESDRFQSYRLDDVNLIVTVDEQFYKRFAFATAQAKRANLLDKAERIALFQAVLYGNFE